MVGNKMSNRSPRTHVTNLDYNVLNKHYTSHPEYPDVPIIVNTIINTIINRVSPVDDGFGTAAFRRLRPWLTNINYVTSGDSSLILKAKIDVTPITLALKISRGRDGYPSLAIEHHIGKLINVLIEEQVVPNFSYTYAYFKSYKPVVSDDDARTIYFTNTGPRVEYIVREYVNGVTLEHYLSNTDKLDISLVIGIFAQAILASQMAHERCGGFTMWDLKPANIILVPLSEHRTFYYKTRSVSSNYLARIIDYGLSTINRRNLQWKSESPVQSPRRSNSVPTRITDFNDIIGGYSYTGFNGACEPIHDAIRLALTTISHVGDRFPTLSNILRRTLLDIGVPEDIVNLKVTILYQDFSPTIRALDNWHFIDVLIKNCEVLGVDVCNTRMTNDVRMTKPIAPIEDYMSATRMLTSPIAQLYLNEPDTITLHLHYKSLVSRFGQKVNSVLQDGVADLYDVMEMVTKCEYIISYMRCLESVGLYLSRHKWTDIYDFFNAVHENVLPHRDDGGLVSIVFAELDRLVK